jgi:hypothetical protein
MRTPAIIGLLFVSLAAATATARADSAVLKIDGEDIYVDIGARDGAGAGTALDLMNVVVVKDPLTRQVLRDRFAIGQLTVVRSGDQVSVARASSPALRKRVRVGDPVAMASDPRRFADPWLVRLERSGSATGGAGQPAAGRPGQGRKQAEKRAKDAELTRSVWKATLGKPIAERIRLWKELLARRPELAWAGEVEAELASLAKQATALERAAVERDQADPRQLMARRLANLDVAAAGENALLVSAPDQVAEAQPVGLAFAIRQPDAIGQAWLYARHRGDKQFRRLPLRPDGDAYLRGSIPADLVARPSLEYFVEAAPAGGEPVPVVGSSEAPRSIEVTETAADPPPQLTDRSRITLLAEYVDFDGGLRDGFDQYYQVEADFMYRPFWPIYAVRLGFGSLSGMGGPKDIIDEDPDGCLDAGGTYRCRHLTYSYIYTELEHRFSPVVAVMVRPQAGLLTTDRRPGSTADRCFGEDVIDCDSQRGLGLRGRVRFGEETATSLVLGVGFTDGVGTLFEAAYASNALPRVPVRVAVEVTDQPIQSDFGVRLVGDVGFRPGSWIYPSLRLSYQARDVDHAGFSGGAGVNFDW